MFDTRHPIVSCTFPGVVVALTVVLVGCRGSGSFLGMGRLPHEDTQSTSRESPPLVRVAPHAPTDGVRAIQVTFDVARIDLPVDDVRHSRKIWNHVDEMRVDPSLSAQLARNGLRVGVISPQDWPAIRTILDASDAQVRRDQLVPQPGVGLSVKLSSVGDSETIFTYAPDQRLVGRTFQTGEKLVNVEYAFHSSFGGSVEIRMTLEIRREGDSMTWERVGGVLRQVPDVDRYLFNDLSVSIILAPSEALLVGLSDAGENGYLLGSRFFRSKRAGREQETLLCFTPQPFQTDLRRRQGR